MNAELMALASDLQKEAGSFIPQAYQTGREKVQKHYGVIKPWGERDNINVELLLSRHADELARSMAKIDEAASQGTPVARLLESFADRVAAWSWVLYPALAMGIAAGVDDSRQEIARVEGVPANDIGVIWLTAQDERVCKKCLYLAGRWFDAKEAYQIAGTIHPGCRCPRFFDVGTPDEAMVGPIPGYRPGTVADVYRDLNIEGLAKGRILKARRIIARGKPASYARPAVNI